ncbi:MULTISPECIES: hypothetical protein [unclassified Caulobacter]|uniref:hypothetical protein n=1 Tax=unclassified Caulobacter TaxID=2648921 RepID=UPI0011B2463E|nr:MULTISPECIES: hypothetical protein [unclassified Caulobacter]
MPYAAATALVVATWLAGGIFGAQSSLPPSAWIMFAGALIISAGWVMALILVFRHLGLWGWIAIPSALLVALAATGIPLMAGACMLAKACI